MIFAINIYCVYSTSHVLTLPKFESWRLLSTQVPFDPCDPYLSDERIYYPVIPLLITTLRPGKPHIPLYPSSWVCFPLSRGLPACAPVWSFNDCLKSQSSFSRTLVRWMFRESPVGGDYGPGDFLVGTVTISQGESHLHYALITRPSSSQKTLWDRNSAGLAISLCEIY